MVCFWLVENNGVFIVIGQRTLRVLGEPITKQYSGFRLIRAFELEPRIKIKFYETSSFT